MEITEGILGHSPPCPHCGKTLDGYASFEGATPDPGDATLCAHCYEWLEFGEGLCLIPIRSETLDEPGVLIELQRATKFVRAVAERMGRE